LVDTLRVEKEVFRWGRVSSGLSGGVQTAKVELVRAGRTAEELSREFEPFAQAIWNWLGQAEREMCTAVEPRALQGG
jgi:hypothetical protein